MNITKTGRCFAAVATTLGLATLGLVTVPAAYAAPVTIDVLTFNDFHGRLEPQSITTGTALPGAAVVAGAINSFRASNPNTLVASAGDSIGASTFTSFIQQDKPTLDFLDAIKLDVSSVGNHEFDAGRSDLDSRVIPDVDFPYLAANLYDRATGKPAYPSFAVNTVGGVSVGFIGAVTEELPALVNPAGISTLEVKPIAPEVNRVATDLTDGAPGNGEADVLILLVHEGASTNSPSALTDGSTFARLVSALDDDIDAIVSGHSHQTYAHNTTVAGWPAGLTRPVLQAGEYGVNLGKISLEIDPATKNIQSMTGSLVPLLKPDGSPAFPKDPAVDKIVTDAAAVAEVKGGVSVGSVEASFRKARQSDGTTDNRGGESTIGNMIADAQLVAAQAANAQIALMNPGGIRSDIEHASSGASDPDGNVTYREAAAVQPFANTLVAFDLTGDQLKSALEQQWQPTGATRPFLKLGVSTGFEYTYDPAAARGSRIIGMSLNGAPIVGDKVYRIVANNFLANGGDNFTVLRSGTNRSDTGRVDLTALTDHLKEHPGLTPDYRQRSVGLTLSKPDADGYNGGDELTIAVSSLSFSGGEPHPSTVDLLWDGTVVGTAAIDSRIVDTTDEVGRASLTVTIPHGGRVGEHTLSLRVPETGTSAAVTVSTSARSPETARELSDANAAALGTVTASPDVLRAGQKVRVTIPSQLAAGARVVLYGPQRELATTGEGGVLEATIPFGSTVGEHRLAAYTADGALIGWTTVRVTTPSRW